MSNRQIQPVRPRDYNLARQVRPRSLWGQIWTITLQPSYFFRTMPPTNDTRQWFWVAVLILGLVGFSAVRQEAALSDNSSISTSSPDLSSSPGGDFGKPGTTFGGGSGANSVAPAGIPGALPSDSGIPSSPTSTESTADVSATLTTALIAASHILLGWFILAVLLCEISLFNGTRPGFGQNLQIAIWTTIPFGIMAGLQAVYYSAGAGVGHPGLSGLLSEWKGYDTLSAFPKSLALSIAIRLTLFWLWSLLLIYRGGRDALNGKRWSVLLVVGAWIIVMTVIPVVTGTVAAEPPAIPISEGTISNLGAGPPSFDPGDLSSGNGTSPPDQQKQETPAPETTEPARESSTDNKPTAIATSARSDGESNIIMITPGK